MVRRCQELPGQLLFQYEQDGTVCPISSTDVNDYIRKASEFDATAKTFRTWGATRMAAEMLAAIDAPQSQRGATAAVNEVITIVAGELNNTRAVCKASYVHPMVIDTFERGELADKWSSGPSCARDHVTASERKLLHVLTH